MLKWICQSQTFEVMWNNLFAIKITQLLLQKHIKEEVIKQIWLIIDTFVKKTTQLLINSLKLDIWKAYMISAAPVKKDAWF